MKVVGSFFKLTISFLRVIITFIELPLNLFLKKGKSYSEETKKFATTLHGYSPKAYEFVKSHLPLPNSRTISMWLSELSGGPGIFQATLDLLRKQSLGNKWMYGQCVLMLDGMSIKKHLDWNSSKQQFDGYVDIGIGPDENSDLASEAIVFLASSVVGKWKIPIGYVLINGVVECERKKIMNVTILFYTTKVSLVSTSASSS